MVESLKDFYFLSGFLNRRVYASSGERSGRISDLVAERADPYPLIIGLVVKLKRRGKGLFLPWERIGAVEPRRVCPRDP